MNTLMADTILMIRPIRFDYNHETAVNNYYQHVSTIDVSEIQKKALQEFDDFVAKLRNYGVEVIVIEDTPNPHTPDSIFPNNWVSFHENGKVVMYPMFAENRRTERRKDIFEVLGKKHNLKVVELVDLTHYELDNRFLEGTGSMVLDRVNKIAYAAISLRTDNEIFKEFCSQFGYKPVSFVANQTVKEVRFPIYHTNVMMCIADVFAVVCLDAVDDVNERQELIEVLENCGKEIIEITEVQKHHFAGNMLQVSSKEGKPLLVMSSNAYQSLNQEQIDRLNSYNPIIHSSLSTIESLGGGSARCMMAEVYLPKNN